MTFKKHENLQSIGRQFAICPGFIEIVEGDQCFCINAKTLQPTGRTYPKPTAPQSQQMPVAEWNSRRDKQRGKKP